MYETTTKPYENWPRWKKKHVIYSIKIFILKSNNIIQSYHNNNNNRSQVYNGRINFYYETLKTDWFYTCDVVGTTRPSVWLTNKKLTYSIFEYWRTV